MNLLHVTRGDLGEHPEASFYFAMHAEAYSFSPTLALDPALVKNANFAQTFPSLEKLTVQYQTEKFPSLGTLLDEAVAQQKKGDLELFGAKVSSDLIALLGLPILAILLFQFSAVSFYVRFNVEGIEEEVATNWSFLLNGWPFLIMSLVTSFVFPVCISVWTLVFVWGRDLRSNLTYLALLIIVLMCSMTAGFAMLQLRAKVRKPQQAAVMDQAGEVDNLSD